MVWKLCMKICYRSKFLWILLIFGAILWAWYVLIPPTCILPQSMPVNFCNIFGIKSNIKMVLLTLVSFRKWSICSCVNCISCGKSSSWKCSKSSNCAGDIEFCVWLFMIRFLLKLNEMFFWQNFLVKSRGAFV